MGLEDGSDLVLSAPAHASQLLTVVQQESLSAVPTGSGGLGASEQRVLLLASSVSPNTLPMLYIKSNYLKGGKD